MWRARGLSLAFAGRVFLCAVIVLYILYPLGALLAESVTLPVAGFRARQSGWDPGHQPLAAPLRRIFLEGKTRDAILGTLKLAVLSVVAACGWGLAQALLWSSREFPGRRWFAALGYLPVAMPPIVGTLAFLALAGEGGWVYRTLGLTPFIRVLLVHAYSFGCYTFAYVSAALEERDRSREEAARSLGAGTWRTFFAATWPVVRAPLLAAALLTFMVSAASFSAPYMLDNASRYLTVEILNERGDPGMQRALSVLLAGFSLAALPAFLIVSKRTGISDGVAAGLRGGATTVLPQAAGRGRAARVLLSLPFALLLVLPPAMVLVTACSQLGQPGTGFGGLGADDWGALLRSVLYGAATMAIDVTLAAAIAMALRGRGGKGAWLGVPIEFGVMLALALPGSAVAVALLSAFNGRSVLAFGAALGGTHVILILAYVIRTLALAVRPARAALENVGEDTLNAARIHGAPPRNVFLRIVVPLIAPALAAGGLLCFMTAAGEYVASLLLYAPATIPASVRIDQVSHTDTASAYALSLCLMGLCAALAGMGAWFRSRASQ